MQGRLVTPNPNKYDWGMEPGDYGKEADGSWVARTPNGLTGDLGAHSVTEHEDGTITVSPSILCTFDNPDFKKEWHGYLERGVWREC